MDWSHKKGFIPSQTPCCFTPSDCLFFPVEGKVLCFILHVGYLTGAKSKLGDIFSQGETWKGRVKLCLS